MIRRLASSRLLRLFSTSVFNQALLSGANLIVSLVLIRYADDHDYGYFVLVQVTILLMVSLQTSWIIGPLNTLVPTKPHQRGVEMVGTVEAGHRRFVLWLAAAALPLPALAYALGLLQPVDALIVTGGVIAGWVAMRRELLRSFLILYVQPRVLLLADLSYVSVLLGLVGLVIFAPWHKAVWAVGALALSSLVALQVMRRRLGQSPGWSTAPPKPVWAEMRPLSLWAVAGAAIYWIYYQSYNYTLGIRLDIGAVADVNAVRLMLMPTLLLLFGVASLLVPIVGRWLQHEGMGHAIRRLWLIVLGLLLINAGYVLTLWPLRDWVTGEVMNKVIDQRDLLLLLWAAQSGISTVRDPLQTVLLAQGLYRNLATLGAVAAAVAMITMWFCIERFGAPGAMMGIIAGDVVSLAGISVMVWLRVRAARAAATPA